MPTDRPSSITTPRVERLFAHRWRPDKLGFLDVDHSPELFRAEHLFEQRAAVITGAPWLGKTRVARQLHGWLQSKPDGFCFGSNLCLTELGIPGTERDLPPPWWDTWRQHQPPAAACWIIDALDEGEERIRGMVDLIVQQIERLEPAHRDKLNLIILSRQRDWLEQLRDILGQIYKPRPYHPIPVFQLAPLDQAAAQRLLGSSADFDRVTNLIQRYELQQIAGYPVALEYLRGLPPHTSDLSVVKVWRGILEHLHTEPHLGRGRNARSEPDARFQAAARMAAVLTLTGHDQVVDHSRLVGVPSLADIFPADGDSHACRQAAREACEIGLFHNTAEGGYRFAQRNIQDWLAAFGLARLRLGPLRTAIGDAERRVFPRIKELLPLLRQTTEHQEVREWLDQGSGGLPLTSDLLGPTLSDSIRRIDRLEELAVSTPSTLHMYDVEFHRLAAPGLGTELTRRLRDPKRSSPVKELLLRIAVATEPYPMLPAAVEIVADPAQPMELRYRALDLVEYEGGDGDFLELGDPVARSHGLTPPEGQLRARVLRRLLGRRLWTVLQTIPFAPPCEPHQYDSRHRLLSELQERMSAGDARILLSNRQSYKMPLQLVVDHYQHHDLFHVAVERLIHEEQLDAVDQALLIDVALDPEANERRPGLQFTVLHRLRACPNGRRRFYESSIEAYTRDPAQARVWSWGLTVDDWQWLIERAQASWLDVPRVWEDAYSLAALAHQTGKLSEKEWEAVHRLVSQYAADVPERYARNQAAAEAREREEERLEAGRRRRTPQPLEQVAEKLLRRDDLSAVGRMRELTWVCFVPDVHSPNITGRWEELNAGLQDRVRSMIRQGLEQGTPIPVPETNEFPGTLLAEAWAFQIVLDDPEQEKWLNSERLQRWLPTALFALYSRIPGLVRRCAEVDQAATVNILLDSAERELRAGHRFASKASEIPVEWWANPQVIQRVTSWVGNSTFQVEARARLLELLSLRSPESAYPIASAWAGVSNGFSEVAATLRDAGLSCLLALDPQAALPLIEAEFRLGKQAFLHRLGTLHDDRSALRIDLPRWSTAQLEVLGRLLLEAYPIGQDPEREDGRATRVTFDMQLRDVRNHVISVLLDRSGSEADDALARLAASDTGLAAWLQAHRTRRMAQALVGELPGWSEEEGARIPVADAVRLLDQADYRLIRSSDDLLDVVCEALQQVEQDVAADLPMLYGKPSRQKDRRGKAIPREHLTEDALQAYIRRRLADLLARLVPDVQVLQLREDQIRYRRRLDLRVVAPCLHRRELATVIIEIKWSDNRQTPTSLVDQLGREYLLGEGLTHGIYLVGWCGRWNETSRRRSTDRGKLEIYLADQRTRFCAEGEGAGLRIEPVVLGVEWQEPRPKKKSR